jgi:predicted TIM-barrel fold metal-dependent hydrolase
MAELDLDEVIDPHIHLFDVHNTPRPTQPLVKMFGWNEKLLRTAAKRLFPKATIGFFGEQNDLINDYLTENYRADSAGSRVGRYVHIEAGWKDKKPMDAVGETEWVAALDDPPAAIVAHADLALGDAVVPVLEGHKNASETVRGIRHMLATHPNKGVMDFAHAPEVSRTAAFRLGMEQLGKHGLTFDAWAFSHQLNEVAELAAAVPQVETVLCHCGTPVGYAGEFQGVGVSQRERDLIASQWRDGISAVAAQPNVSVKLSGLLMPVVGFGYEDADKKPDKNELVDRLGPLVRHCIDAFGPQRCMVASNFPVDRVSASYGAVFDAMVELTASDGAQAQAAMFAGTAARFYRI